MNKENLNRVKKEFTYLGILLVVFIVLFQAIFFKENFLINLRTVLSIFWMFILPGYFILFYWQEKLDFTERTIISIALSAAIIGIFSYYFGLIGLNIKYHAIIFPLVLISIGIFINLRKYFLKL